MVILHRIFSALILVIALFGIYLDPIPVVAQGIQNLDVVLLIDNSGSMSGNDPAGLRWSAAQLFVDLANSGDRIAAFAFSTGVIPLGEAVNGHPTLIFDKSSRQALKQELTSRNPDGETNMAGALEAALSMFESNPGGNRPVVVFLTDGRPWPEDQRPQLLQLIRQAGGKGIPVFPILLGSDTDAQVSEQMIRETGGLQQEVRDATGLLQAFGKIYAFMRPGLYSDELAITGYTVGFRTNSDQAITTMSIIVPRSDADQSAVSSIKLVGEEILHQDKHSSGAEISSSEAVHYQMVTVSHNSPISGEWTVLPGINTSGNGLLIANSAITLELITPTSSVADSFVAPRVVPNDKQVLFISRALQSGVELADVPISISSSGEQALPLDADGLSTNQSEFWRIIEVEASQANPFVRMEIQVGDELTPFRLRKDFVIEIDNVPHLVIDSPSTSDSGLLVGGKLRISTHFDGGPISDPTVIAYIYDVESGEVSKVALQCDTNTCLDESFTPQAGKNYQIIISGSAIHEGRPISDGGITTLQTEGVINLGGLDVLARPIIMLQGDDLPSVSLPITAYLQSGQPEVDVQLDEITPVPTSISDTEIGFSFSPIAPTGKNSFITDLLFNGFNQLPPGDYLLKLSFSALDGNVVPSTLSFQIKVTQPEANFVGLESPISFGIIPDLTDPQVMNTEINFGEASPFDVIAQVVTLTSSQGPEKPDLIQVDVGQPSPNEGTEYSILPLNLSALRPLRSGEYRGTIQFHPANPDNPAQIIPNEISFVFSIPQSSFVLDHFSIASLPVGCPEIRQHPQTPDTINFGAITSPENPSHVDLFLEGKWIRGNPDIQAEISQLHHVRKPGLMTVPVSLSTGSLQRVDDLYVLPLIIDIPPGLKPGTYMGEVVISNPDVDMEPEKLRFSFVARTNLFGRTIQWARPKICSVADWYVVTPFPRFKGMVGWIITIIVSMIVVGSIKVNDPKGELMADSEESGVEFTSRRPAYILVSRDGLTVSNKILDSHKLLVEIRSVSNDDIDEPGALVIPRIHNKKIQIGFLRGRTPRSIPSGGKVFGDAENFFVRTGRKLFQYRIFMD